MHGRVAAALLGLVMVAVAVGAIHEARRPAPNHLVPFNSWVEVSNWLTEAERDPSGSRYERWDTRERQTLRVDHHPVDGAHPPFTAPGRLVLVGQRLAVIERDQLSLYVRSKNGLQKIESHSLATRCPKGTSTTGSETILATKEWVVVDTYCSSDSREFPHEYAARIHRFRRTPAGSLQALPPMDAWRAGMVREMLQGRLVLMADIWLTKSRSLESRAPRIERVGATDALGTSPALLNPQNIYRIDAPNTRAGDRTIEVLITCDPSPPEMPCRATGVATSTYLFYQSGGSFGDSVVLAKRRQEADEMNLVRLPVDGGPPSALRLETGHVNAMLGPGPDGRVAALTFRYEGKQIKPRLFTTATSSFGAWGTLPPEADGHLLPSLLRAADDWPPWTLEPDGVSAAYTAGGLAYARNTLDEPAKIWTYDPRSRKPPLRATIQQSADSLDTGGPFVVVTGLQGASPAITVFKPPALPRPEATFVLRDLDPEKQHLRRLTIQSVDEDSAVLVLEIGESGKPTAARPVKFMKLDGTALSSLGELQFAGCPESSWIDCEASLVYLGGHLYLYEGEELVEAVVEGNAIRETGRWVLGATGPTPREARDTRTSQTE